MGLLVRNPLAFPAGVPWGFDPTHIAAPTLWTPNLFSGVPLGANFLDLTSGVKGTPTTVARVGDALGPAVTASLIAFPNATTCPVQMTLAGIVRPTTLNSNPICTTSSNNTGGMQLQINQTTNVLGLVLNGSGGFATTLPAFAVGIPYFVACSVDLSNTASYKLNFVVVRLDTGQVFSLAATSSLGAMGTFTPTQSGNLAVAGGSNFGTTRYFAAMQSPVFLTINELLKWADDPWGFWYPRKKMYGGGIAGITLGMPGAGISSAAGGFVPAAALSLPGAGVTAAPGSLAEAVTTALPGAGVSSGAGVLAQLLADLLSGAGATAAPGSFAETAALAFQGAGAAFSGGALTPSTPIVFIQSTKNDSVSAVATLATSFAVPIKPGSFIVVAGMFDRAATSVTVTNDKGDTVTDSGSGLVDNATVGVRSFCKAFFNATAGAQTVTVTPNASVAVIDMFIWEFNGLPNPAFDKVQTASDATTTPTTPSTGTLSQANEAAVGYAVSTSSMNAAGSGWTSDGFTASTVSLGEHRITAATTAIAGTGGQAGAATCQIWVATFKSAANPTVPLPGAGITAAAGSFAEAIAKAITGAGAATAAGSLVASESSALPGAGMTASAGSLAETITKALAGAGITAAAGSLNELVALLLSGAGVTAAAGLLANSISQTVALTGAGTTTAAGSFAETVARLISGAGASVAAGSFAETVVKALTGAGITAAAAGQDATEVFLPSFGTGVVVAAGSFAPPPANFTGAGISAAAGTFIARVINALIGAGVSSNAGSFAEAVMDALAGAGVAAAAGQFAPATAEGLSGAGVTSGAGTFADALANALVGVGVAAAAGQFTPAIAEALAGAGVSMAAGSFSISTGSSSTTGLTGAGMTAAAGSLIESVLKAMSGAGMSAAAGSFGPQDGVALSGAGMTATAGALAEAVTEALGGAGASFSAGAFANAIAEVLAGAAASMAAGNFSITTGSGSTFQLPGAGVSAAAGSFADAEAEGLSGAGIAVSPGSFVPGGTRALSGAGATAAAGVLAKAMAEALQGTSLQTSAGSFGVAIGAQTAALVGVSVQVHAGTWTITIGTLVSGPNPERTVGLSRRLRRTVATIH